MAFYGEIRNLFDSSALRNKVETAVIVAAEGILNEGAPSVARKAWAAKAFLNPNAEAKRVMMAVLAAQKDTALATLMSVIEVDSAANNTIIQNNVDNAIDLFIDADAGV